MTTGDEGICGNCIWSLTELATPAEAIDVIGDGGICGICTMSLGPIVACITSGGDNGEVAGELTQEPDREWAPDRCCTPLTMEVWR